MITHRGGIWSPSLGVAQIPTKIDWDYEYWKQSKKYSRSSYSDWRKLDATANESWFERFFDVNAKEQEEGFDWRDSKYSEADWFDQTSDWSKSLIVMSEWKKKVQYKTSEILKIQEWKKLEFGLTPIDQLFFKVQFLLFSKLCFVYWMDDESNRNWYFSQSFFGL